MTEPLPQQPVIQPDQGTSDGTRTMVTVLFLLFLNPIGVIVMWFWSRWQVWVKILISLISLIPLVFILIFLFGAASFLSLVGSQYGKQAAECQTRCKVSPNPSECTSKCVSQYVDQQLQISPPTSSSSLKASSVDSCDPKTASYLTPFAEVWPMNPPTIIITSTTSSSSNSTKNEVITKDDGSIVINLKSSGQASQASSTIIHIQQNNTNPPPSPQELAEFQNWAKEHDINLYAMNKSYDALKNGQFDPAKDSMPLENIRQVMNTYKGLQLLPESILEMMRGKAIYFSTASNDPNRAVYIHEIPEFFAKLGVKSEDIRGGIFLVDPVSVRVAIHEVGHIVGTNGIEGYAEKNPKYNNLLSSYEEIFQTKSLDRAPCGYVTSYATTNSHENFAEHFAYYVVEGGKFRERAKNDLLLGEKYDFLKNNIFEGQEY